MARRAQGPILYYWLAVCDTMLGVVAGGNDTSIGTAVADINYARRTRPRNLRWLNGLPRFISDNSAN